MGKEEGRPKSSHTETPRKQGSVLGHVSPTQARHGGRSQMSGLPSLPSVTSSWLPQSKPVPAARSCSTRDVSPDELLVTVEGGKRETGFLLITDKMIFLCDFQDMWLSLP